VVGRVSGLQFFPTANAATGQGREGQSVTGEAGPDRRTQKGPYRVRSSTIGIMTVSVRAGCGTEPMNSTV
jgi:hypothetical protein